MLTCGDNVRVIGSEEYPVCESFYDMDLKDDLLRGIYSYGYERPSAIQQRAIMPVVDGRDTIGQAQSGTGKTATFLVGALQRMDCKLNACQALVLCPTRELAMQTQGLIGVMMWSVFATVSTWLSALQVASMI